LLSGDGGVGKTILHLQAEAAYVLGREWLATPIEPGRAMVICCEDDEDELHRRVAPIAEHYDVGLSDLKDLYVLPLVGCDTVLAEPNRSGRIEPTKLFNRFREAACDIRPKLITIDNLADVYAGSEIDRVQVRQFVALLGAVAIEVRAGVVLTAHPSLSGMASGSGSSGSTGWHNSARARMYMTKPKAEHGESDPDLRELRMMKNNYGPPSEELRLRWSNGLWVPARGTGPVDKAAGEQEAERMFLELLDRFSQQGRNVSHKKGTSYAPALFAQDPTVGPTGITKKDLEAAMLRLFATGKIRVENYGRPSRPNHRLVRQ